MSNFKNNNYKVIRSGIAPNVANFVYKYFFLKRMVAKTFFQKKYISPFTKDWGTFDDPQIPDTYCQYGDIAMDTLLREALPVMKEETEMNLIPTYSYARLYKNGDILPRHKDRPSCEISCTIHLGGDTWPIYLEPDSSKGRFIPNEGYVSDNTEGIKVDLNPGDMLAYRGCVVEHWRESFEGKECAQAFLHYVDKYGEYKDLKYDSREHLGLPEYFRGFKD